MKKKKRKKKKKRRREREREEKNRSRGVLTNGVKRDPKNNFGVKK